MAISSLPHPYPWSGKYQFWHVGSCAKSNQSNFNSIGLGVSKPQVTENRYLPCIGWRYRPYTLTCYTVMYVHVCQTITFESLDVGSSYLQFCTSDVSPGNTGPEVEGCCLHYERRRRSLILVRASVTFQHRTCSKIVVRWSFGHTPLA